MSMNLVLLFHLLAVSAAAMVSDPNHLRFSKEIYSFFPENYTESTPPPLPSAPPPPQSSPASPSPSPISSKIRSPLVPAFFVIGDSSVDCGTNNYLATFARADRLPYGRDFDTHQPTGRFCNGRIPVDFIALRLGLPFVPSYLGQSGKVQDMIQGVNYASVGAGIIFSSHNLGSLL